MDLAVSAFFGGDVVWHVEFDKHPSAILEHHYPGVPNFGDVKSIDWEKLAEESPIDILTGGYPCFPAGTPVLTDRGYLPIEKVAIGDRVLTHMNRWRSVTATMTREHEVVEFAPGMYATPDHPFWTREPERYWNNGDRQYRRRLKDSEFTPAADLKGKFVAMPMNIPFVESVPDLPEGLSWWHVGRWLADGHTGTNNQLCISVGASKVERDAAMFDGWAVEEMRTATRYRMPSAGIASPWLREHFGSLAHGKKLPVWALAMPEADRRELLDGYLSGDGYEDSSGYRAVTVSDSLMVGIRMLATTLNYTTSVEYHRTPSTTVIEGRTVNQRNWWRINIAKDDGRFTEIHGDHRWMKMKRTVKPAGRAMVYDLTVDEDHSFNAWGLVVHNCQPFSHAGRRKGKNDERHLWPYVERAIRVLRPKVTLLENVSGHVSLGLDSVLGDIAQIGDYVAWDSVRASSAGAPHRRERVFIALLDARYGAGSTEHGKQPPVASVGAGQPDGGIAADADGGRRGERVWADLGGDTRVADGLDGDGSRVGGEGSGEPADEVGPAWCEQCGGPHVAERLQPPAWMYSEGAYDIGAFLDGTGNGLLPTPTAAASKPANWKDDGRPWWLQSRAARGLEAVVTGRTPVMDAPDDDQLLPTSAAHMSGSTPEQHLARKPGREVVTDLQIVAEHLLPAEDDPLLPTPMTVNRTSQRAQTGRPTSGPDRGGASYGLEDVVDGLLPTPTVSIATNGAGRQNREGGPNLRTAVDEIEDGGQLFPSPAARDAKDSSLPPKLDSRPPDTIAGAVRHLNNAEDDIPLLPTPAVNDMGAGKSVEEWDAWTDRMRALHANGNGHGPSLSIEALRLLPTPNVMDGHMEGRTPEQLAEAKARQPAGYSNLKDVIPNLEQGPGLLPTPSCSDARDGSHIRSRAKRRMEEGVTTSYNLNHLFENEEMYEYHMGGRVPTGDDGEEEWTLFDVIERPSPEPQRHLPTPDTGESLTGHGRRGGRPGNGKQSGASLDAVAEDLADDDGLLPTPATANSKSRRAMTASTENGRRSGGGQSSPLGLEETASMMSGEVPEHLPEYGSLPPASQRIVDGFGMRDGRTARDGIPPDEEGGPGQVLPGLRGADGTEAVQRSVGGQDSVPEQADVLQDVREDEGGGREERDALAGEEAPCGCVRRVSDGRVVACASHRPGPMEQRPGESGDPVRVVPSETPLAGGPGEASEGDAAQAASALRDLPEGVPSPPGPDSDMLAGVQGATVESEPDQVLRRPNFGPYDAAIRRWEHRLGRLAPMPSVAGKNGRPRLNPVFVEWLMGLPLGWVTDPEIGLPHNAQLKALGNGVVPQQAYLALGLLMTEMRTEMPRVETA